MTNPIPAENALTGNPQNQWDITGVGSTTIVGFPTAMSVDQGGQLNTKVHSPSSAWTATVYRLGWYAGNGARQVATFGGAQTTQPAGTEDGTTGMVSCANWTVNGTWTVPSDACPGVYLIKAARNDNPTLISHVGPFVVRNPNRVAPLTVLTSDTTWQAYNHAGVDPDDILDGRSIYGIGTASTWTWWQSLPPNSRTRAVSYDRPLITRHHHPATTIWNAEYPLIRWLERCGYDVDYLSCVDVDTDPAVLDGRQAVIVSGHSEYWSQGMREVFEDCLDHFGSPNLVFLTGNEVFWRIRWLDGARRTYACWKDTHDGSNTDPDGYTGTWQDTRGFNPDRRPAALLIGQRFRRNGIASHPVEAAAEHAASPFWRDTAVADLTGVETWASPSGLVGFEGDEPADTDPGETPANLVRLSETQVAVDSGLADDDGDDYDLTGTYTHAFTLWQATSGCLVFGSGTNQYSWALDDTHDRFTESKLDVDLQQALVNLLADFRAPPTSVPAGLVEPEPVLPPAYSSSFFDPGEDLMVFVAAAKNAALDAIADLITHIAAHTAVPDGTGSSEVAGGSYARQAVTWDAAASEQVVQDGALTIPIPAGTTVVALGYRSALTSGTHYGHGLLGNSKRGFGTVDSAGVTGNLIQSAGHTLTDNERVVVYNVFAESLPAGLTEGTVYHVVGATTNTFQLSTTQGGSAVDLTGQGELQWGNCVPETFGSAGNLTIPDGQLVLTAAVI